MAKFFLIFLDFAPSPPFSNSSPPLTNIPVTPNPETRTAATQLRPQ